MHLSKVDLNLLVTLDALLNESHVGRAAQRVGLTQPAASHALGRLRILFDDPLLVRCGVRMALTPRAEALRGPVALFIESARGVLRRETFDPASSQRRFRIMMPDLLFHLLLPPLIRRLEEEAPGIRIEGLSWRGPGLLRSPASSNIDFVVTSLQRELPDYERHWLYDDHDVIAVRTSHPDKDRLTSRESLSASRHVAVVGAGETADVLDDWLAAVGVARDVVAIAPNYVTALSIAAATDLVAIVPRKLAENLAPAFGLRLIELPVDPGTDSLDVLNLVRSGSDPATIWMRGCMREVARIM